MSDKDRVKKILQEHKDAKSHLRMVRPLHPKYVKWVAQNPLILKFTYYNARAKKRGEIVMRGKTWPGLCAKFGKISYASWTLLSVEASSYEEYALYEQEQKKKRGAK